MPKQFNPDFHPENDMGLMREERIRGEIGEIKVQIMLLGDKLLRPRNTLNSGGHNLERMGEAEEIRA